MRLLLLFGLAGLMAWGAPQSLRTGTATLTGTVVGLTTDEPVPDVEVTLHGRVPAGRRVSTSTDERGRFTAWRFTMGSGERRASSVASATTDPDGQYRLARILPGDYTVCVSTRQIAPHAGRAGVRLPLTIDRAEEKVLNLRVPDAGESAPRPLVRTRS